MGRVKGPGGTTAVTRCWVQLTYIAGYYVFTGILRYWVPSIISDTLDMPTPAAFTVRGKGTSREMEGAGGATQAGVRLFTFRVLPLSTRPRTRVRCMCQCSLSL